MSLNIFPTQHCFDSEFNSEIHLTSSSYSSKHLSTVTLSTLFSIRIVYTGRVSEPVDSSTT